MIAFTGPALIALLLSLVFGPLVLLIAPFLFGIGHMSSTTETLSHLWNKSDQPSQGQSWARLALLVLFAGFGMMKLSPSRAVLYPSGLPLPEVFLLALFLGVILYEKKLGRWIFSLPLLAAAMGLLYAPVYTFAVLLFGHNLIAFVYWWKLEKAPKGRAQALAAGVFCFAVGLALALGLFDRWLMVMPLPHALTQLLDVSQASSSQWARTTMPFLSDGVLVSRWVCIAAFGQLMHYHVWLFSIPKLALPRTAKKGIGRFTRLVFAAAGLALLALALYDAASARVTYLAFAAAHGFAEIGTLPLLFAYSRQSENGECADTPSLEPLSA